MMAAGNLLSTIINDTIGATPFSGSKLFEESNGFNPQQNSSSIREQQQLDQQADSFVYPTVEMSPHERFVWVLLFSFMVFIAVGGNVIVVYIVSTNKEMKSVTNYFLVNLSLADTMVSTLNVIFNFISMLNSHWPFGTMYCKISNFIAILSISASVFTLTAISCDRYNAILYPLRPRMSHSHAISWILLIWTLSSALAMPNAIYSTVVEDRLANDNIGFTCTMLWPDGRYPLSSHDHIYNIVILVVTYLVPILTMAILYYQVGKELWGYEAIGENIDKQQRAILAKKKIVKMMIVVVIIFALCWFPYHAFFVVNYYMPNIFQDMPLHYQRCYLFMYWLAMSNTMYNPIIIYFMNSNFREEFKKIFWLFCCCRTYKPTGRSFISIHNATIRRGVNSQLKRQNTLACQSKNLAKFSTVDKTSKLSMDSNISNKRDLIKNNNCSVMAQDDDNVKVLIEKNENNKPIIRIGDGSGSIMGDDGTNKIDPKNDCRSEDQFNCYKHSLVVGMSKCEQEEEQMSTNQIVVLENFSNEKLIDLGTAPPMTDLVASLNITNFNSTEPHQNKVWI